jgi:hypothetical protein
MQAMVDRYKDIPHIEYALPSSTPWCCCVTFGVICIVKYDKTNVKEQGWLSFRVFSCTLFHLVPSGNPCNN